MSSPLITVVTPCYNEEPNVRALYLAVKQQFAALPHYRYEHLFIDNGSTDGTRAILRSMAEEDRNVKVILNTRNFGPIRSPVHGLLQAEGDAVIGMAADFQDPPELIPQFIAAWEAGAKVALGVKSESAEHWLMYKVRDAYYRLLASVADVEVVHQAMGYGIFDRRVIQAMRRIADPYPFLRGLVAEIGYPIVRIPYRQAKRAQGTSKISTYQLFDVGLQGIISHSKVPLRIATLTGVATAAMSMFVGLCYLLAKLIWWQSFNLGVAPLVIGFFFLSAVQLIFIGVVGEYVGAIYTYVKNRPLVIEAERLNF